MFEGSQHCCRPRIRRIGQIGLVEGRCGQQIAFYRRETVSPEEPAIPEHSQCNGIVCLQSPQCVESRLHQLAADALSLPLSPHRQPVKIAAFRVQGRGCTANSNPASPCDQVLARDALGSRWAPEFALYLADRVGILLYPFSNLDLHQSSTLSKPQRSLGVALAGG